ncbi:macro domain-containing protein [Bacillus sp. FJAT-29937]|uniref:macro domain-containing protein n=1 Tax=Bacillus sp. FJAT-29937 TaxID=1720553 RepID=UPI000832F62B|nr:macro domain-containing protein [Bacillus sp. FJAT-29937]
MQKENRIYVSIGKRIFQMLGQWSILSFAYTLSKNIENEMIVLIIKFLIFSCGLGLLVYYVITSIGMLRNYNRFKKSYSQDLSGKKVSIGYEVGSFWEVVDRFKGEESVAVIMGINNRFCIDKDYINSTSLINNYISTLSEEEHQQLDSTIHNQLNHLIIEHDHNNLPMYPYGTLCTLKPSKDNHYEVGLLAMCEPSNLNTQGKFASTRRDLIFSFEKLFEEMSNHYTDYTLVIPLIGTKSSGGPLTHEEVAKYLISAFANYTRIYERRLARRLVVSIYDKDFETVESIMEIKSHIDMECGMGDFSYSKIKNEMDVRTA